MYVGIRWRPGDELKYSSGVVHILNFGSESLNGLELVKQVRLGGQQALVIHLSLLPWCWN